MNQTDVTRILWDARAAASLRAAIAMQAEAAEVAIKLLEAKQRRRRAMELSEIQAPAVDPAEEDCNSVEYRYSRSVLAALSELAPTLDSDQPCVAMMTTPLPATEPCILLPDGSMRVTGPHILKDDGQFP